MKTKEQQWEGKGREILEKYENKYLKCGIKMSMNLRANIFSLQKEIHHVWMQAAITSPPPLLHHHHHHRLSNHPLDAPSAIRYHP